MCMRDDADVPRRSHGSFSQWTCFGPNMSRRAYIPTGNKSLLPPKGKPSRAQDNVEYFSSRAQSNAIEGKEDIIGIQLCIS